MLRWTKLILIVVSPLTLIGAAILVGLGRSNAAEEPTAKAVAAIPAIAISDKLIVHEWGTFTTFSGSNGVHLDFRPLLQNELPGFVCDRANPWGEMGVSLFSKGRIRTRVRMETPVTYFYTDIERKVRASVEFPQGLLTEFYPPVVSMAPAFDSQKAFQEGGEPVGQGKLDWGEIDLIPTSKLLPAIDDQQTAAWMGEHLASSILPFAGGDHYAAARNTDSALVHVRHKNAPKWGFGFLHASGTTDLEHGEFIEKFLFYRGVGKFDVPVSVSNPAEDQFLVTNTGTDPLPRMIVLRVTGDQRSYAFVPGVQPGKSVDLPTAMQAVELDPLQKLVVAELIQTGLYAKEAQAMVDTWSSSWFTEEGLRLFYLVPQKVTDEILPLTITPKPDEQLRVMVGRVEIMPKSQEAELLQAVALSAQARAEWQVQHAELTAEGQAAHPMPPVPPVFVQLGRFAEPALSRIRTISPEDSVKNEIAMLLWQLQAEAAQAEEQARTSARVEQSRSLGN